MKHRILILIGFLLGVAVAVGLFVDDAMRRDMTVTWHPGDTSGLIDPLYPTGRFDAPSGGVQVMRDEPGYTDLLVMKNYRTVRLAVDFENPDTIAVAFGMRLKDDGMELRPATGTHFEGTFDIAALRQTDGRIQCIISAPELRQGKRPIVIRSISLTYGK